MLSIGKHTSMDHLIYGCWHQCQCGSTQRLVFEVVEVNKIIFTSIWGNSYKNIFLINFSGGELISQRFAGRTFLLSIYSDYVSISLVTPNARTEARVSSSLLDNKWHTIEFLLQMGSLKLLIDRKETVIANSTYNTLMLTDPPNDEAAILIIGKLLIFYQKRLIYFGILHTKGIICLF